MSERVMTLEEIRRKGLEALSRELGPVGLVRFLQQFEAGSGDYSVDRHKWLEKSDVRRLSEKIRRKRQDRLVGSPKIELTAREKQILFSVSQGLRNQEIAIKVS